MSLVADAIAEVLHRFHIATAPAPIEFDDGGWMHGEGVEAFRYLPSSPGMRDQAVDGFYHETQKQQTLAPGTDHVEGVVWHYTDTRSCGAPALARRLLDEDNDRAASWHACVDRAGKISQSVSARCGSWHAGGSQAALFLRDQQTGEWTPLTDAQRGRIRGWSANSWAYGIELENAGELRLVDGRWLSWPFVFGGPHGAPIVVPDVEVAGVNGHHGWHAFTAEQIDGARRVLTALVGRYGLRRHACTWTHHAIDPENRVDPGPEWERALPGILDAVFGQPA